MTRLIDADALIDTLYEHEFSSYIDKGAVSTLINDEPTVDAIPIEFIRERMEGYYKNSYTEFGACLETLIEDWRKEHETD